jgi:zinc protease
VSSIERLDRAAVAAFHRLWFRPDLLSVAVVGAVEAQAAVDRVARAFGDWRLVDVDGGAGHETGAPLTIDASLAAVDPPRERRRRVIPMMAKSQADIAYGFVTISRTDPSYYAWWVMNTVLGQYGLGGRLGDNIRERQGMAYYVYSAFDPHVIPGPMMIRAGVDGGNVDRTIAAIDQEITALAADGPTAQELEETQRYLIGSLPRMLETNGGIATFLQVAERFDLGVDYDRRLPGLVGRVTREAAHAAAAALSPARAGIAIAGPYEEVR